MRKIVFLTAAVAAAGPSWAQSTGVTPDAWQAKRELIQALHREARDPLMPAEAEVPLLVALWLTHGEAAEIQSLDDLVELLVKHGISRNLAEAKDRVLTGIVRGARVDFVQRAEPIVKAYIETIDAAGATEANFGEFKAAIERLLPEHFDAVSKELGVELRAALDGIGYVYGHELEPGTRVHRQSTLRPAGRSFKIVFGTSTWLEYGQNQRGVRLIGPRMWRDSFVMHRPLGELLRASAPRTAFGPKLINFLLNRKILPQDASTVRLLVRDGLVARMIPEITGAAADEVVHVEKLKLEPRLWRYGAIVIAAIAAGYGLLKFFEWLFSEESPLGEQIDASMKMLGLQDAGAKEALTELVRQQLDPHTLAQSIRGMNDDHARILWNLIFVPKD